MLTFSDATRLFSTDVVVASLGLLGFLLAGALTPQLAQAQTPVTTIQNGNADTRLQLNYDGGLHVPGTYLEDGTENDSIPITGAGTRMMWYPAKAAVRAGRVGANSDGTQWDAANVGPYSAAFGVDTEASGEAATAMGQQTTASGDVATAMGSFTTASGNRATAMGRLTTASGEAATAMGDGTTAGGETATAMGQTTTASAEAATAMGFQTTASDIGATAMGRQTTASGFIATTMGDGTTAATPSSVSIGRYNRANTTADNTLFVAGNGSGPSSRSNALVLGIGGNLTISGNLTESSDRRLKTSIEELGSALPGLSAIEPVRFTFKAGTGHPSGEQIGLLAQEVQKEFPELVDEDSEGYLSLSYSKMTAVLLKGLQEQQSKIERQQAKVDSLKQQVRTLRKVKQNQKRLTREVETLKRSRSGVLPAGWGPAALLMLLIGAGGFAGGLLWRR